MVVSLPVYGGPYSSPGQGCLCISKKSHGPFPQKQNKTTHEENLPYDVRRILDPMEFRITTVLDRGTCETNQNFCKCLLRLDYMPGRRVAGDRKISSTQGGKGERDLFLESLLGGWQGPSPLYRLSHLILVTTLRK